MSTELTIRKAELEDINTIGYLAYQIWPVAYRDTLSFDRLQYMLNLIYHPSALRKQMTTDKHEFLIAEMDDEPVGFASYSRIADTPLTYKLHKLYVNTNLQGKGLGKALLDQVKENCIEKGARLLHLNVKRDNKARFFYEKQGFVVLREEDIDIGNGYFMNDYLMEAQLLFS